MRLTLGRRVLIIVAAAVAPIVAVVAANEILLRRSRDAEIHALALASAEQAADQLQRIVEGAGATLLAVATAPSVRSLDVPTCNAFLQSLGALTPQYVAITVFDKAGDARCASLGRIDANVADRPYFMSAIDAPGTIIVGGFTIGRSTSRAVLPIAYSLDAASAQTSPIVVVAGLDIEQLSTTLESRTVGHNGSVTVADSEGRIVARVPAAASFIGTKIPAAFMHLVTADSPGTLEVMSQDGTRRILGYVPVSVPPLGLYVSAGIATDVAFAEINRATIRTALLGAVGLVAAAAVALFLTRRWLEGEL